MEFKYFEGPNGDMSGFEGQGTCSLCGNLAACFALDSALCAELPDNASDGKIGCVACLRAGRFEFWHDTEIGMLTEVGLEHVYKHNEEPPPGFPASALVELRRTPQIVTWQQEVWLTHCNDFMVFLGTWEPSDFTANAKDGDGRSLFLEMTDSDPHLWDASIAEGAKDPASWYATYYVFRCYHCDKKRGNWDCA